MSTMHMTRAEFGRLQGPPPDPVMQGARGERRLNYNSATGQRLFRQNHMPIGRHAGKIMQNVPAGYLLRVRTEFPTWPKRKRALWFRVWDYVDREIEFVTLMAETAQEAPAKPSLPRQQGILISPTAASRTVNTRYRCELCHDDATMHPDCQCDHTARKQRNAQRYDQAMPQEERRP